MCSVHMSSGFPYEVVNFSKAVSRHGFLPTCERQYPNIYMDIIWVAAGVFVYIDSIVIHVQYAFDDIGGFIHNDCGDHRRSLKEDSTYAFEIPQQVCFQTNWKHKVCDQSTPQVGVRKLIRVLAARV